MPTEVALTGRVLTTLNSWPDTRAVKAHGSSYSRRGDPDIWGCHAGVMFLIEMKRPGEKPTHAQEGELRRWAKAGAVTGWADNVDDALAIVREIKP